MALVSNKPANDVLAPKIIASIDNSYPPWWNGREINWALGHGFGDVFP